MFCLLAFAMVFGALPARAFFFSRNSVRTTVQRLVEAIENENIEALKDCISPRFLAGNPEIPGRLEDAFEKFNATRISFKIASIRETDGIAAVKLNWTKTTTNPMNNWTYRDIGNEVVMYFNAASPYQLVGLESGNLFGISFLLSTRIVVPAPDERRLEVARKELEVTESQAAFAREQAQREAAKEEARLKQQEIEEARRQAKEEASQKAKEASEEKARKAEEKAREAKEKAAQEEAAKKAEKTKKEVQPSPAAPGSDLSAEELANLVALESVIKDALAPASVQATASSAPNEDLSQAVRDKAEDEARRMLRATPSATSTDSSQPPTPPPTISPELEKWRQDRLGEIRAAQAAQPLSTPRADAPDTPEAIKALREIEEATRIQAELKQKTNLKAIQMLAEQRAREKIDTQETQQTGQTDSTALLPTDAAEKMADSREQDMLLAKAEAQARAKAVLEEIARLQQETPQAEPESDMAEALRAAREAARKRAEQEQADLRNVPQLPAQKPPLEPVTVDPAILQQIEEEARLQSAIKAKAEEDAKALALQRQLDTLTNVSSEALARLTIESASLAVSPATSTAPTDIAADSGKQSPEQFAAAIRQKAEKDSQALLFSHPTPGALQATHTNEPIEIAERDKPKIQQPVITNITETQKQTPSRATVAMPTTNAPFVAVEPQLAMIRGGAQPGGPQHDFKIGLFEVTNDEFAEFLNNARANPYNGRGSSMFFDDDGNVYMDASTNRLKRLFAMTDLDFDCEQRGIVWDAGEYKSAPGLGRHPAIGVSWYGALKYCNWLTIQSGLGEDACAYTEGPEPEKWHPSTLTDEEWQNGFSDLERQTWIDAGVGFRLPMNSYNTTTGRFNEFYVAAAWNGASNMIFAFGRDTLTPKDANFANTGAPFENNTTPVGYFDGTDHNGAFATNPNQNHYGIHDLSGNVWEWSNDTTGNTQYRALFGGAFDGDEDTLKNTFRGSLNPYRLCDNVGFRVAITPAQKKRSSAPQPLPTP